MLVRTVWYGIAPAGGSNGWSRLAGEDDAGDLLEVVEEADGVPTGEKGGEGVALVVAELEGEEAVGFEGGVCLGNEAAIHFEPVGTGVESGGGFMVADLGVESWAVGGGDVGRVGDDDVKLDDVVLASPLIASR